jgi:hypothetical protein
MNQELINHFACEVIRRRGQLNKAVRIARKNRQEARDELDKTCPSKHMQVSIILTRICDIDEHIRSLKVDQETCDELLHRIYQTHKES